MKRLLLSGLGVVMLASIGCSGRTIPLWGWPGTVHQQQRAANKFDPYPSMTGGPPLPEVRPREYENPPAEAYQGRWNVPGDNWYGRGGM